MHRFHPAKGMPQESVRVPGFTRSVHVPVWTLFAALVIAGIHGSSIGLAAGIWDAPPPAHTLDALAQPLGAKFARRFLMTTDRAIRTDEWLVGTPWALSQFSHRPRFPVANTSIGDGQNMLLMHSAPVAHLATLARPSTWGYFLLGRERGLAWLWWFQPFACFTALFLLLEIMLVGRRALAAFGALWFCASAFVVGWSHWPAYFVFFPALACVAAYRLLRAERWRAAVGYGAILGLSSAGFTMLLYPAWQVPLAYVFLAVLAGVCIRDGLLRARPPAHQLAGLCLAAALAALLIGSFVASALPAMETIGQTVYPGKRISSGGEVSFAALFKGLYNFISLYRFNPALGNESESASFFHLFPLALAGLAVSPSTRRSLGGVGTLLLACVIGLTLYMTVGAPTVVARISLLSFVPGPRADIGLGLASILLCCWLLAHREPEPGGVRGHMAWAAGALVVFLLYLAHGMALRKATGAFVPTVAFILVPLTMGVLAWLFLAGRRMGFCVALGALVVGTSLPFNPLSTGLSGLCNAPLAREIARLNEASPPPLWVAYGDGQPGMLVSVLGGRTVSGVHYVPALRLWRTLDPGGKSAALYNRYAHVSLYPNDDPEEVKFDSPQADVVRVFISPEHPAFLALGARYLLWPSDTPPAEGWTAIFRSARFSIFEIR